MKKLSFLLIIALAVLLSACNADDKTEKSNKKQEPKLLTESKNTKTDEIAQNILSAIAESDNKKLEKYFEDTAVKNYCEETKLTTMAGEPEKCTRASITQSENTFEPDGDFYTILAQYDKNKTHYIATHDNDTEQKADTTGVKAPDKEDMILEKFTVEKSDDGQYKVSHIYKWSDSDKSENKVLNKFKNKKNVYELKGKYSDLFGE